jgi:hypothetical protein
MKKQCGQSNIRQSSFLFGGTSEACTDAVMASRIDWTPAQFAAEINKWSVRMDRFYSNILKSEGLTALKWMIVTYEDMQQNIDGIIQVCLGVLIADVSSS